MTFTEPSLSRASGVVLVLGAVLMFTGASIPFLSVIGGKAWQGTFDEVLTAVANGPAAWRWANGLIAVAAVATALGLAGVCVGFGGRIAAVAGLVTFALGAALDTTARIINMTITPWVARQAAEPPLTDIYHGFYRFSEGLIKAFVLISLVALILFGVAALQQQIAWLGTLLIVFGAAGLVLEVVGAAIPAIAYVATAATGVWLLTSPLTSPG